MKSESSQIEDEGTAGKIEAVITTMPKTELHIHIEGAIPLATLFKMVKRRGRNPEIESFDDLRRKFMFDDFSHFIENWTWKNELITKVEDFKSITFDVLEELHRQNVRYAEAIYAPGDYSRHGFKVEEITENIIEGKQKAESELGIKCRLIADLIRDHGPVRGKRYLDQITPYREHGAIGIGIGGSEHLFPPEPYREVFQIAAERGFRLTAHAGEAAGAESVRSAVEDLNAERIGHGVRAVEEDEVMALLKRRQIPLEMCVVSNVKTGVYRSVKEHPIRKFFDAGIPVTVNSDDPTMFDTSITFEYLTLVRELQFSLEEVKKLTLNGIKASFLPKEEKEKTLLEFENSWTELNSAGP